MIRKQNSTKEFTEALRKEGYSLPGNLILWAMAVGQWMAILIVGLVFFRMLF